MTTVTVTVTRTPDGDIENYYATVRMPDQVAETIREDLRIELDHQHRRSQPEPPWANQRTTELAQERRRLARGVVNGSIPEDLAPRGTTPHHHPNSNRQPPYCTPPKWSTPASNKP